LQGALQVVILTTWEEKGQKMAKLKPKNTSLTAEALVPKNEQPYPIPENWVWVRLGEISTIKGGKRLPKGHTLIEEETLHPYIRVVDFKNNTIDIEHLKYLEAETQQLISNYTISSDDVYISVAGTIGKVGIIPEVLNGGNLTENAAKIVTTDSIDKYYLLYVLSSDDLQLQISLNTIATTQAKLALYRIGLLYIPLPPLPEQHRIVARIESLFEKLDQAKELVQTALDSFETRKAAILHKAFTGELIGKNEIKHCALSDIVKNIRIGPFGTMLHAEEYIIGGTPVINPKHISNQKIAPQENISISKEKADNLTSYRLAKNDIIIGRRGEMGRTAPITEKEKGWICGTGSMIIRLKDEYCASLYSQILSSQATVTYLETNAVGSTMKNLNEKIVKNISVPMFSEYEQQEIIRILDSLLDKEKTAHELCEVIEKIDLMKKAILAHAFRGKLGTNNPKEESATSLLYEEYSL